MLRLTLFAGCMLAVFTTACTQPTTPAKNQKPDLAMIVKDKEKPGLEVATLGAGCFWCVEAIFQELVGVHKVESGYSGGKSRNPSYRDVTSGNSGHAEVVQVHFDPEVISFEDILEVFWYTHDQTTLYRQGADTGTQYRSAIFYHSEEQRRQAEFSKKEVATQFWDKPIVTEITAFTAYYPAEAYHQDYYVNNPNQGYCQAVIAPKVAKFRKRYAEKLKSGIAPK
jgi:peptide-methionine (S)-S-oxide reductase